MTQTTLMTMDQPLPSVGPASEPHHTGSWIPTLGLIRAKMLELRRRRGLMVFVALLTIALPVLVLGIRLIFHLVDPKHYGPAGSPGVFGAVANPMADFGFIIAATVGTAAGTTDLTDGVFRHLVVTGRSRVALYFSRIPAGLGIIMPMLAVGFTLLCLVTAYAGTPNPKTINLNGFSVPTSLSESQLKAYLLDHPQLAAQSINFSGPTNVSCIGPNCPSSVSPAEARHLVEHQMPTIYTGYTQAETSQLNPPINEMVKIGAWMELVLAVGFLVGLGLGSLVGQRTVSTVIIIVLQIIITPIMAGVTIPYFLNGQRMIIGVALDQLRPAGLVGELGPGHIRRSAFGGAAALGIPPMAIWAMVSVIVGWVVVWTAVGAWRMATRDA